MPKRNSRAHLKVVTNIAETLGFVVVRTKGGHRSAVHPATGTQVFFSSTSVSPRGAKNAIAQLRRTARQADVQGGAP